MDLRTALRLLAKNPGATALAVLSIALGIGLTSGIFSVVDAYMLRPLSIQRPAELYAIESRADDGQAMSYYGWPDFVDMTEAGRGLVALAAYQRRGSQLNREDGNVRVLTSPVTANYFAVLGVNAALGTATVEEASGRPQVVIGYELWQRRFGGDPRIVGRSILLNRKAFLVAGVMPREFSGLTRGILTDVWVSSDAWFRVFGNRGDELSRRGQFQIIGRLHPGANAERTGALLDAAIRGEGKHKAAPAGSGGTVLTSEFTLSLRDNLQYGGGMLLILGAVLFVACANVAQLRLAQAEARKRELSVRMALGAGAWRVASTLLIETVLLCIAGAGLGILLAHRLMEIAGGFLSGGNASVDYHIQLDGRVLAYTAAALKVSAVLAGISPIRHALRLNVAEALKAGQGAAGERRSLQRTVLIAAQVAVSVALFGCAVLFVFSLRNAAAVRPGMDPGKNLLVLTVAPGRETPTAAWCEPALERLASLPGVRGATYARRLPLSGSGGGYTVRAEVAGQPPLDVMENNVAGNYFGLMGTRVVAGRGIDAVDRAGGAPGAVVNETFARRMFPGRSPLGEWVRVDRVMRQVVGVAQDAPSIALHERAAPYLYLPYAQLRLDDLTLMVETAGAPAAMERAVRQDLQRYDPHVRIFSAGTLQQQMEEALAWDRMMASIASGLGMFGVLLTAAGLFGVMQYSVSRRTREFGLRMAIGADAAAIQRLVLSESLRIAMWGVPAGLGLLGAAVYWARAKVLGISPLDARIYVFAVAAVVAVTAVAGWLPARRATHVDPLEALRSE